MGVYLNVLAAACAALLVTSCSSLSNWQVHDSFTGLRTTLNQAEKGVDVLVVHGMGQGMDGAGEPVAGYSYALQDRIAGRLEPSWKPDLIGSWDIRVGGVTMGQINGRRFGSVAGKHLTFYELGWAHALKAAKVVMLDLDAEEDFRERGPQQQLRAPLNSLGKTFVNTHLADPVIYAGSLGVTLRHVAQQAICYITRVQPPGPGLECDFTTASRKLPAIAVIAHSLGSALMFESLSELSSSWLGSGFSLRLPGSAAAEAAAMAEANARNAVAEEFAAAVAQVYMLANQLPLIELHNLRAPASPQWLEGYPCPKPGVREASGDGPARGLDTFLQLRQRSREGGPRERAGAVGPVSIVAFSDPNDLLTYFVTDRFKKRCTGARFSNVTVTNAATKWIGLFADPYAAHTGFIKNDRVIEWVTEGGKSTP